MTRPFFSMGPYKARLGIAASAVFSVVGDLSGQIARAFSAACSSVTTFVGSVTGWDAGDPVFIEGDGDSYDVAATGPYGYDVGGTYDVDASGTQLPSGLTLSAAGILTDGGAVAGTTTGVVFGYNEPGSMPILTINSGAPSGTLPYMATAYPAEGTVPAGMSLSSPEDSSLRSSTLSTWPDGSAQVMVIAGHKTGVLANSTVNLTLRPTAVADSAALTTADIASKFTTGITVNFGTSLNLNSWGSPDRIWWANSQVICARYRLPITNKGVMEAVIDVHAFAGGRAFVEVVIENCKQTAGAYTEPATQTYTGATVAVNGTTIKTVSSSVGPGGAHPAYRAWYCSGWVGGDPLIEITHDVAYLEKNPWFWKTAVTNTADMQTIWAADTYSPLVQGARLPDNDMDAGGETGLARYQWIGPLCGWDCDYISTGSKYAARAVLLNHLCALGFNVNYRLTTGDVPTVSELTGWRKRLAQPNNFPQDTYSDSIPMAWEGSHAPAAPLVAFLLRPSPCYIELAQKIAAWTCTEDTATPIRSYSQTRDRAWSWRNYGIAAFLTPESQTAHKTALRAVFSTAASTVMAYANTGSNTLNVLYDYQPANWGSDIGRPRGQTFLWMHEWLALTMHMLDKNKVAADSTARTAVTTAADWLANMDVRFINDWDSDKGGWRLANYGTTFNTSTTTGTTPTMLGDWQEMLEFDYTDAPPANSGSFLFISTDTSTNPNWDKWSSATNSNSIASSTYAAARWLGIVVAKERDIPGASTAWDRVVTNGGISNLSTFLSTGVDEPRYNRYPRNV